MARARGFSGQAQAAEIVVDIMTEANWDVRRVWVPVLKREQNTDLFARLVVLLRVALVWVGTLAKWPTRGDILLYPGQTAFSMIRAGVCFGILCIANTNSHRIISLHGSLFMEWAHDSREARLLRWLVSMATRITVLGPNQAKQLEVLGVSAELVAIVRNTCLQTPIDAAGMETKFSALRSTGNSIQLLFLSNLIPSKGYPVYLEALDLLASHRDGPHIEAILCGPLHQSDFGGRFATLDEAMGWIDDKITTINRSSRVKVSWIRGARGEEKQNLFRSAHVFVLPTQYAVEAQPLVLIEAMASGCAVITSDRGEIPFMLEGRGIVLGELSPQRVGEAIGELANDPARNEAMAVALHQLFQSQFSHEQHARTWRELYAIV
jgi:glycosyltransferase involved in cell wall biosynthesis